ncbi:aldehyde dehydrogenase family protein [Bradyrhizobium sp. CB1650]|uniref:aldehyde dehydrogenase family protein n=1 Tax=Bradyrhizobium sp. CB1650 TaxID=3039153 RepID=UPI002434D18C|nr:aldehyde dehydrogenase family protein [Bradyrhizobium sp. CB1650]WGD50369.1 aldehyde dehydrogenase family protein [Bradyrhizobium sp. CB1650]
MEQGPLINQSAVSKVDRHVANAKAKGATIVTGGSAHSLGRTFFTPTVIDGLDPTMLIAEEESFGPIAAVSSFEREYEVLALANQTRAGLASYVFTRDLARAFRVGEALNCGMVGINAAGLSFESAPFGGVKESGFGREGSRHGIDEYTDLKYMLIGGIN